MSDRHVFKGRGVNRGKYLREAYDLRAQKVVVTWEEKQSRGSRYTPDSRGSYQTNKLAVLNGYLVKLVAPKSIAAQVPDMQDFIAAHSAGATRAIDLAAGRVVGLACLASDDAPGRDANPFAHDGPDAPRARAWDDGFLIGLHEASGEGGRS